jgi:hypothetical protein
MPPTAKPTVIEAVALVMAEVQGVGKSDRNTQQNYSFRGIDAVVNAVGPALRKYNVVVVPISATCESESYTTAKGTPMRGVTLTVGFRFYGPAGDHIDAQVCGEASDSGDKAVPKAHSVAYRTLLLQALCIPTDEPDPDSESHERAAATKNGQATTAQRNRLKALRASDKIAFTADHLAWLDDVIGDADLTKERAAEAIAALEDAESKAKV